MTDRALVEPVAHGDLPGTTGAEPAVTRRGRAGGLFGRAALAVGSGLILVLAFPSVGWWPLAPLSVALLTIAARGARPRHGALLGLVAGLAFFVPHLHWSGIYVGAVPWFALAAVESLYLVAMGALLPLAWRVPGGAAGTALAVAGLWVLQEAVRGRWPFGGFPWGRLAFSQSEAPTAGLAALGGAPLVTAAVGAAGGLLAWAAARAFASRADRESGSGWRPVTLAVVGVVAVLTAGIAVPRPVDGDTVRVAAVQGNVARAGLEFNAERRSVLDNHGRATQDLARRVAAGRTPAPDLVVWPENASDIDPLRNADAREVIDTAVDAIGVPTLVGAVLREPGDRVSNAAIVWTPGSGPGARYIKQHPVPFGEYIPYRSFFRRFSDKVDLVRRDFAAGDRVGLVPLGPALAGTVICFEVAYDDLVRSSVAQGADLLVVQTNNATFGRSDESVQQLAMSRLRAIESGRSVVHISTVGISAIIAPDGTVVRRSGHFRQEVLESDVALRTRQTVSTRVGAAPEWLLAGLALGLLVAGAAARRRAASAGERTGRRWIGARR